MTPSWRAPKHVQTTPVLDSTARSNFWPSLIKALAVPTVALVLLAWFGLPALRIQYWYHGSYSDPIFDRCLDPTFDGWHDLRVNDGRCPVLRFFPFDIVEFFS